jgi:hypothetical protein
MELTKLDRNRVFKAIERGGADPREFNLRPNHTEVEKIHSSGSFFRFREEEYGGSYAFAASSYSAYRVSAVVKDGRNLKQSIEKKFDRLLEVISRWADEVCQTVEAPDLWAQARENIELISNIQRSDFENTPFTETEQRQISSQLEEIKKQLSKQFRITGEQLVQVREKVDEITEASKRMGRKDWFNCTIGIIATLIIASVVLPGVGEQIFAMIIQSINNLYIAGGGPPELPPL